MGCAAADPLATWARGVADATDRCLDPLYEVGLALGHTWQELVERAWLGLLVQSPGLLESGANATAEPVAPVVAQTAVRQYLERTMAPGV